MDYYDYEPPPPFYRRWWFITFLILLCGIAGGAYYGYVTYLLPFKQRAAEFDLAQLEEMESATLIFDRKKQIMGRIFVQNRDTVPLQDFPAHLLQAVIAAEDNRFYKHKGIDYVGMARAFVVNWKADRIAQGGSTLTMQLARNTFSLLERSYERKLVEVYLSKRIEEKLSKNKILELYLNRVYYGAGFYGAEAAARGYFGKSSRNLTLSESAMLAGLLKSPNNLSPWSDRRAAVENRNIVLRRMYELEMISRERYEAEVGEDLDVKNRAPASAETYAMDYIRQQVIAELGFDETTSEGYRVFTTIDPVLQKTADESLKRHLTKIEQRQDWEHQTYEQYENYLRVFQREKKTGDPELPDYLQGALIALDNHTGAILALSGGRNFQHSEYNRAMYSKRPPGTAFKPLVYAAAFEKGFFPGTIVEDAVMDNRQVMIGGTTGILGEWGPESEDNRFEGAISARRALVASKNAATVRMGLQTGLESVITLAKSSGISTEMRPYPATFLGSSEVTLSDLTLAYTQFPEGGWRPQQQFIIERIENKDGELIFAAEPARKQVIRATSAYQVHSCLEEALETGTADRAKGELGLKHFPAGGKTGTAYNFTDTWFMGYSSAVTIGVWAGFDKPRTLYRGAFSKEVALPIWVDVMNASLGMFRPGEFSPPPGLDRLEICLKSGMQAVEGCVEEAPDPVTGRMVSKKVTAFEWVEKRQLPPGSCYVHGDGEMPIVTDGTAPAESGQWPKAVPVVDFTAIKPVTVQAPTVLGEDPYQAIATAQATAEAAEEAMGQETIQVRRAEPVRPFDKPLDTPVLTLDPPPPLKF